jgi:hypothetical protein
MEPLANQEARAKRIRFRKGASNFARMDMLIKEENA